ncbi:MAG: stage V sporulation protein AA [Lachnospiraceae bacterium]
MEKIVYLKLDAKVRISSKEIYLKDICKLYCRDETLSSMMKQCIIYTLKGDTTTQVVISALKVISILEKKFNNITVFSIGETEVIVEEKKEKKNQTKKRLKVVLVSLLCFFGTTFTVMAYHNDIGLSNMFQSVYELIMGKPSNGFTVLEISYSIGLGTGIFMFFNHIGERKITNDPTPVEVEMRQYEDDVNIALVEISNREEETIDVS